MKYDRLKKIEDEVILRQSVSNEELCALFDISMQTLYRDLKILEDRGKIKKVYGGVVSKHRGYFTTTIDPISERDKRCEIEKNKIAELASTLVNDGDVIFLDSGSTVIRMLPFLVNKKDVTVISHSLPVIEKVCEIEGVNGVLLGGQLNKKTKSFSWGGVDYPFFYHKAFIATVGCDKDNLLNIDIGEGAVKAHTMSRSNEVYLVCDHTKFNTSAFNIFGHTADLTGIITDEIPDNLSKIFKSKKINIYLCK